ncbi:YfiR family protein [Thermodesulforhabdus norvegica]|uniref:YfiR family protein n=1 Tax=Thermodesulforhabdus norvegica TaxID=39841 RepID=A0A1I4TNJ2_9BACT|nr:YfiR family protein [Thermodesulforhabdus norvegica]SFM78173.1 protein of unknown function [Thermodesulforhabdus norvegica]
MKLQTLLTLIAFCTVFLLTDVSSDQNSPAYDSGISEERLKAAFVYNFLKFTEWPSRSDEEDTLLLCTSAPPAMTESLKDLEGRKIGKRTVKVLELEKAGNDRICHALFIDDSSNNAMVPSLLHKFRNDPVLTIGDRPDFCRMGGIIQLFREGNKLRFNINLRQARKSGIKISSRLLKLARRVIE